MTWGVLRSRRLDPSCPDIERDKANRVGPTLFFGWVGWGGRLDQQEFDEFAESLASKMGSTFQGVAELLLLAASEAAEPKDLSVLKLIQVCPYTQVSAFHEYRSETKSRTHYLI
jgi:hypothetical protein